MEDMTQVIEDAVNDAQLGDEQTEDVSTDVETSTTEGDTSTEADTEASGSDEPMTKEEKETSTKVEPIVKDGQEEEKTAETDEDSFAKKFGLASKSVTGRENRIPYSRVKKIVEKNEKDVTARVTKETEAKFQPQIQEFQTKVKTYEDQLQKVAEFEKVLEHDPKTFLERLSQVPAYKPFFDYVQELEAAKGGTTAQPAKVAPTAAEDDPRPLPNKTLADGSKVYDLEGLDALMAWQARQVEKKVSTELETRFTKRYEPIEAEWKQKEYLAKIAPVVDKQIAEARTWPLFVENEAEIVKALQEDPNLSLDGAWRKIAVPKMVSDRTKIRSEVLAELKKAPVSTAAGGTKTAPSTQKQGPRSLEDIIAEEIKKIGG